MDSDAIAIAPRRAGEPHIRDYFRASSSACLSGRSGKYSTGFHRRPPRHRLRMAALSSRKFSTAPFVA
jgi:hypothetical protein